MTTGGGDPEPSSSPASSAGETADGGETAGDAPQVLAFYLPQFHPTPENDEWWEPGFTEWTNVVRARPLFPGHYQPHLPGELGFYDLRVPEVREQQAALARQYGISGFVYYHYWFHGRRLLERPFEEVLRSGRPDFPFALCWANEEWTRNWDALSGNVLMEQTFSEADDLAHIRWLVQAFADERYITIDGRPLLLIYRSDLLPDAKRTADLWRSEARAAGFPDLYLALVESRHNHVDPRPLGFDATVGFRSDAYERLTAPLDAFRENVVLDYGAAVDAALHRPPDPWKRFPGVMVGWDNTARRKGGAVIF
ncbi:MAG TPA: glycoside hydrolase family 99-like domain-containing protein, partial [Acidimicrobiales bacterium]